MPIDWDNLPDTMKVSNSSWKLQFYKDDGTEAIYEQKEDGVTHELEYVNADQIQPKNPAFFDPKKGPLVEFTFKDLTLNEEVTISRQTATRFFKTFTDLKPQIGDKVKIKRTGHGFETKYQAKKI